MNTKNNTVSGIVDLLAEFVHKELATMKLFLEHEQNLTLRFHINLFGSQTIHR